MDSLPTMVEPSNSLSFVADRNNCYVGEMVTLFVRFTVPEEKGTMLQISFPTVMQVESSQIPEGVTSSLVEVDQKSLLDIPLKKPLEAGKEYEITLNVRAKTFQIDQYILCEARIYNNKPEQLAYEAVQIAVACKGRYLQHLPELYESDNFVSRFLMLIESFWKPINQQIDQVECYFDPLLTPSLMLPWLSSWVGLSMDYSLPVNRMRSILKSAMMFYQQRGTLAALKIYLEMFTAGDVNVIEKRSSDFVLGQQCKLGVEKALGKGNQPNSVQVDIKVLATELDEVKLSADMYKKKVQDHVRTLVPAHTAFTVNFEILDNTNAVITKGI